MQKRWITATIAATLLLGISVGATAAGFRKNIEVDYSGVKIKVDGKIVDTADSQPFIVVEEGRTYVPARYLAEALGAKVGFDSANNTVLAYTPKHMETKVEGGEITYSFPYFGASMKWPAAGQLRPNNAYLLQQESADAILQMNRIGYNPAMVGFETMVGGMMAGLKNTLPIQIAGERAVNVPGAIGAKEILGTVTSGGQTAAMRVRFVADNNNMWFMMVLLPPGSKMSEASVTSYLDTFSIGK